MAPIPSARPGIASTSKWQLVHVYRKVRVLVGGHMHAPFARCYNEALLLNPGSVGLPYEATDEGVRNPPWAEYGVVERRAGSISIELRRVPIDVNMVMQAALRGGMPHAEWWTGDWR